MRWPVKDIPIQQIDDPFLEEKKVELHVLREDLTDPNISGNKWRKLKYNLLEAERLNLKTIVTVGGPHSNHIAATAAAGKQVGFKTIGMVRGYEAYRNVPTISFAEACGMEIRFLDKAQYTQIESEYLPSLRDEIGDFSFIPMGGSNANGVQGCVEIHDNIPFCPDVITTACGTGATAAGIISGADSTTKILGFPAMKNGGFLKANIVNYLQEATPSSSLPQFDLVTEFHFGGFAKINNELARFIMNFYDRHCIPLDGVYVGKMIFGLYQMIASEYFAEGTRIVAVHTGGLQGNRGLMERYGLKLPTG